MAQLLSPRGYLQLWWLHVTVAFAEEPVRLRVGRHGAAGVRREDQRALHQACRQA